MAEGPRQGNVIVLTKDSDFVQLLERRGPPPQVVWLTCGNTSNLALTLPDNGWNFAQTAVTGIVRTIQHEMIAGKMGELPASELHAVEDKLREILAL